MTPKLTFIAVFLIGTVAIEPTFAQDQPQRGNQSEQGFGGRRGPGFGFGRGQGFGRGRGFRNRVTPQEQTRQSDDLSYPIISNHGGVVQFPNAAHQPRAWTKLVVDLTSGGPTDHLNPGLEKVAKYVNLYAGGGAKPAEVKIAVVLHGNATLTVLNSSSFAAKFNTDGNPNLNLLRQLHEEGVEFYVCGQSLISKGSKPAEVVEFVHLAVSALTAIVNLQTDDYAYVPISSTPPKSSSDSKPMAATDPDKANALDRVRNQGAGAGHAMGPGFRAGRGKGAGEGMQNDMTTLHAMFADRDKINRSVKILTDGAEAITESDDPAIADMIKEHVPAMEDRVLGNNPLPPMTFHPVFVELIKHANDYTLSYDETDQGIKVKYESDDPYVVMLVQEHAKLVSRFIKNGMEEIHTPYELPTLPR